VNALYGNPGMVAFIVLGEVADNVVLRGIAPIKNGKFDPVIVRIVLSPQPKADGEE
jgi:hypothetical protein